MALAYAGQTCLLSQGESAFIQPGTTYRLWATRDSTAYRARTT
ncbi:hypothetical protein [Silvimonas amylolytica]